MTPRFAFNLFKWLLRAVNIKPPSRRDVLIVEDIPNDAELIQSIVRSQGYTPYVCSTMNAALLMLNSRPWFRILLDLNLGRSIKKDGVEIMEGTIFAEEAIRTNPHIKIVFVTGHASALDGSPSSAKFPCIVKGTDFSMLDNALASVLSNGEQALDLRLWKLFLLFLFCCACSFGAGFAVMKYKLFNIVQTP